MKRFPRLSRLFVPVAAIALATFTSCNRGYGCPTNFSINDIVEVCVSLVVGL